MKGKFKDAKHKIAANKSFQSYKARTPSRSTKSIDLKYTKTGVPISYSDTPAINSVLKRVSTKPVTLPKFNLPK